MTEKTICERIAGRVAARLNCIRQGNLHWAEIHESVADSIARNYMPSGAGFDCGTRIDWDRSNADRLVFKTEYHHMNEAGYYDGWTSHNVTVRASLVSGFTLTISGRNRNDIKGYIAQTFESALSAPMSDFDYRQISERERERAA